MPVISYRAWSGLQLMVDVDHVTPAERALMLATCHHVDYGKLRAGLDLVADREKQLNAHATAEQKAIGWGGYAWLRWNGAPGDLPACTVYGQLHSEAESRAGEDAGTWEHVQAAFAAGWRYGRWYSAREPGGAEGPNHLGHLHPLSAAQFEAARAAGWPDEPPAG